MHIKGGRKAVMRSQMGRLRVNTENEFTTKRMEDEHERVSRETSMTWETLSFLVIRESWWTTPWWERYKSCKVETWNDDWPEFTPWSSLRKFYTLLTVLLDSLWTASRLPCPVLTVVTPQETCSHASSCSAILVRFLVVGDEGLLLYWSHWSRSPYSSLLFCHCNFYRYFSSFYLRRSKRIGVSNAFPRVILDYILTTRDTTSWLPEDSSQLPLICLPLLRLLLHHHSFCVCCVLSCVVRMQKAWQTQMSAWNTLKNKKRNCSLLISMSQDTRGHDVSDTDCHADRISP